MTKPHTLASFTVIALLQSAALHADGLAQQSEQLFNTMVNATSPTAHLGQRRGVFDGGSLQARNRIVSESLMHVTPPSFEAGCGGIDLYAGSFSFINADQFQALLRAIAANATGFQTRTTTTGSNPTTQAKHHLSDAQRGAADLQGNLIWQALKRTSVAARFAGGDDALLEAIMSVTGSLIVGPPETAPDGKGESPRITALRGNLLAVRDLLWGPAVHEQDAARRTTQSVQRYRCDDRSENACLTPTVVSVTDLVGFVQYTSRILLGDPERTGAVGLVEKFRWGNVALTDQEKAFMELAPHGLGAMLHNLGQRDTGMARDFTEHAAPVIALEMTKLLLDDLIGQATQAAGLQQNPYAKQVIEQIRTAKQDVALQYSEIAQRYGNLQTLMAHYSALAQLVKGPPLSAATAEASADATQ